jgi:Tfp pilus assembly protein FimT
MVEVCIVTMVIFTVSGFAVLNITGILPGMRANNAMYQTLAQLRRGREEAIAQRRNIRLQFLDGNQIQLTRQDVPNGTTVLSTVTLENNVRFRLFEGIPDSPDSFGNDSAVDFGAAASITFLSDGTLVDDQGNPLSGSVFLGLEEHPETARAVTILGATGRVRSYRWTGESWIQ